MHRCLLICATLLVLTACGVQPPAVAVATPRSVVASPTTLRPTVKALRATPTVARPTATAVPPSATPVPPTTTPVPMARSVSPPVRLVIPAIGMDRELVSVGLDRNRIPVVPNHDVGWYNLSAGPGQGENVVLWGHVLRFKSAPEIPAPFARMKELPVGAPLTLVSADGVAHRYVVIEKVMVTPDQVDYILPKGRELVTMVSCIGEKVVVDGTVEMTQRLITIAAPAE